MSGLFSLGGGQGGSSSSQQGIWGLQAPYLQALYQNAFNTAAGQSGIPGGNPALGGVPDPPPVRPIPSPGHSGKGAIRQYEREFAAWQARQPPQGQPQAGQAAAGNQAGQQVTPGGGLQPGPAGAGGPGPAGGLYSNQGPGSGVNPPIGGGANQMAPGASPGQTFGQLPNITDFSSGLASNLYQQAQGESPYLQAQIGHLGQNIGQFWQQQLLPGIANEAGGAGQYGGARQGIAQGLGAQQALQSFQQGATDLYQNNWNNGAQRAGNLYNLGMAPYTAQFAPLQALSGLLGQPTVLGSGSAGGGWNANIGFGPGGGGGGTLPG